jgi:predicted transcriptional regulator
MDAALDDIAFLANSENRVAAFETLVEAPRPRSELLNRVDASRVTITRILRELEDRDWITRSGREYEVTPLGEWVHDEFVRLVDEMEAERRLHEPLQWFPSELLTFDVRCLRDAELVILDGGDATVFIRRVLEFHRSGDHVRGVATVVAPVFVENHWESTVHGETRLKMVITPEVLEIVLNHPTSARQFREMLAEEDTRFYTYEDVPMSVGIVDGTVGINLTDEQGVIKGGIVSDNAAVYEWAVDLFETCREEARPVTREELTG